MERSPFWPPVKVTGQTWGQRDQQWALYQARKVVERTGIRRYVFGYRRPNGAWFYTFCPVGSPEHFARLAEHRRARKGRGL